MRLCSLVFGEEEREAARVAAKKAKEEAGESIAVARGSRDERQSVSAWKT